MNLVFILIFLFGFAFVSLCSGIFFIVAGDPLPQGEPQVFFTGQLLVLIVSKHIQIYLCLSLVWVVINPLVIKLFSLDLQNKIPVKSIFVFGLET